MKSLLIRLILAVQGYVVPVQEIEARLSVIAPVKIEVIDLANPQRVENFYKLHYSVVNAKVKRDPVVFLHSYFIGGLSGGKASRKHGVVTVAIVPGYDERNLQVILHELLHLWGVEHNSEACNLMNEQPCGYEIREKDILTAKKYLKRREI